MLFSIDIGNGVAIYEQIVRQVKFAIAEGTLQAGQMLPSLRSLSVKLALNPNTVARAYQQLQSAGIVEAVRGVGMIVLPDAVKICSEDRRTLIAERLRSVLSEALHGGLTPDDIQDIVRHQLKTLVHSVSTVASDVSTETIPNDF